MTHLQAHGRQRKELTRPKTIYLSKRDRPWFSIIEYYIYLVFRKLYVAVWFYFLPFIVLLLMYFIPVLQNDFGALDCSGEECQIKDDFN